MRSVGQVGHAKNINGGAGVKVTATSSANTTERAIGAHEYANADKNSRMIPGRSLFQPKWRTLQAECAVQQTTLGQLTGKSAGSIRQETIAWVGSWLQNLQAGGCSWSLLQASPSLVAATIRWPRFSLPHFGQTNSKKTL